MLMRGLYFVLIIFCWEAAGKRFELFVNNVLTLFAGRPVDLRRLVDCAVPILSSHSDRTLFTMRSFGHASMFAMSACSAHKIEMCGA